MGLYQAKELIAISRMLDRLEKPMYDPEAISEMKDVLIEFIKLKTGVK